MAQHYARALWAAVVALAACGGSNAREASSTPNATSVRVLGERPQGCNKLGSVQGRGRDAEGTKAEEQSTAAGQEQASKLGGNAIFATSKTAEAVAGSGGTEQLVVSAFDVYHCP